MAKDSLSIDPAPETERIVRFVRGAVDGAGAKGAVVGLSGGVDSAVVGALCVKALGKDRVLALLMPSDHTPKKDTDDAQALADSWGVKTQTVPISRIVKVLTESVQNKGTKVARANVEARVRMTIIYYYSNSISYLVAGTGDRSEELIGYFSKWGDGGVDFLPIAHLYKTQVRELGAYLGLPRRVVNKPASPQLWPGQKATDEIPTDYDNLDVVLSNLFDKRATPSQAAAASGVSRALAERVLEMHRRTEHKRSMPPSLA